MSEPAYRHILVLADIEGSSGCGSYRASRFMTRSWARACLAMSQDVDAVVRALLDAGVPRVTVQDFHRTAYNLLPEVIDPRARIVCGYHRGPVPGIGHPGDADGVMMLGMHAASGSGGFLPHTLTSRLASIRVNGRLLAEVELFAASLAPFGIHPLFFSGCPVACAQARERIAGLATFPIDKNLYPRDGDARLWRRRLAAAAVAALSGPPPAPYFPRGPFEAAIRIRDGLQAARRMAAPWGFRRTGATVPMAADNLLILYDRLICLCYLSPLSRRLLPLSLMVFNAVGWLGRQWVRRQLNRRTVLIRQAEGRITQ